MRVLKGFSRLEMCFNIQYGMMMEEIAFVYNCIQKCSLGKVELYSQFRSAENLAVCVFIATTVCVRIENGAF